MPDLVFQQPKSLFHLILVSDEIGDGDVPLRRGGGGGDRVTTGGGGVRASDSGAGSRCVRSHGFEIECGPHGGRQSVDAENGLRDPTLEPKAGSCRW